MSLEKEAEDMGYYDYPFYSNPYVSPAKLWLAYDQGFERARQKDLKHDD